jgi:hypothetical protein
MAPSSADRTPLLMSQDLHGTTPEERVKEIAAAMHTFVQVHRCQPRYLVLHPDDFTQLAPALQQQRSQDPLPAAQRTPLADRVLATLTRGSLLLADTEDPAWDTPAGGV